MGQETTPRDSRLWHPFADMGAVQGNEFVIDRAEDVWVWDAAGTRYLDATAALWYSNAGHGRAEIIDAIADQMRRLDAYHTFGDFANEPAMRLADRLAEHAPMDDARVFLASGGGDGIETAYKIARRYWLESGEASRTHIVTRTHGYHGTHGFGTSIAGIPANRDQWGPLSEDNTVVPYDSVDAFADAVQRLGAERVAAVFLEPVVGAGGVYPPPPGYIEGVAEACRQTGVLFVCDSVIAAFGRLGTWFGIERFGVRPDMIVFAKGVTSGYLPLGGVVVAGRVAEPFFARSGGPMLRHGATYSGHPAPCTAALANLDLLEREGLMSRGKDMEDALLATFRRCAEHPMAVEARGGTGTMAALELDPEILAADPLMPNKLSARARAHGLIIRPVATALVASPPLTATQEHFDLLGEALTATLDDVHAELPAASRA
jgi:putrescine---pyruvate transaminase